jgi:predicted unusual protein kinase regulating ubiquinone biosynthesis (AarF/ABC1/UbiB family)
VVVAAAVALVRRVTRRDLPVRHLTTVERTRKMAQFTGRAGAGYAMHRARRAFASAERRDELDRRFQIETTEQAVALLGDMKGALMKVGQMASYLDQGLPENVRHTLAQLQQDAPPMSVGLVAEVIEAELGARPETLFAEWDPDPIAAASIGQVHRAVTRDGRAVAVKVQYPGVDQAIGSDLATADVVFRGLAMMFPGLEPEPVVEELKLRLSEELDYAHEARNQHAFADYYRDHPFIHIPDVVDELSTRRVLTTELALGSRFDEVLEWSQHERNLAAETIYRFAFGSIYRLGAFNGDPHPGNYLFRPGGQVTFLDFGLVKRFTRTSLSGFQRMLHSIVLERDPVAFRTTIEELGLLKPGAGFSDADVVEYFSHFYDFVATPGPYSITEEYASSTVRHIFDPVGEFAEIRKAANVPTDFVIIQRINLGLYAIFGQLNATGDWRRIAEELWPWVDGPPSTPMARAALAWTPGPAVVDP